MKDNEIIKTLECCLNADSLFECYECNYYGKEHCLNSMIIDALDLINRQKANAEGLTNAVKFLNEQLSSAKAEAVKEYAERLKEKAVDVGICDAQGNGYGGATVILIGDIDNLVKEMVGEG